MIEVGQPSELGKFHNGGPTIEDLRFSLLIAAGLASTPQRLLNASTPPIPRPAKIFAHLIRTDDDLLLLSRHKGATLEKSKQGRSRKLVLLPGLTDRAKGGGLAFEGESQNA
jgi:hypothetical protein